MSQYLEFLRYCTTPGTGNGSVVSMVKMLKVLGQSFYVMGKALSGELSCTRTSLISSPVRQFSGAVAVILMLATKSMFASTSVFAFRCFGYTVLYDHGKAAVKQITLYAIYFVLSITVSG